MNPVKKVVVLILSIFTSINLGFTATAYAQHYNKDLFGPAYNDSNLNVANYLNTKINQPGKLIAKVPLAKESTLPAAGESYRILYSTLNQFGKPALSTGVIYFPRVKKLLQNSGKYPVLAWAHGTVGNADRCAPSMNIFDDPTDKGAAYLNNWLKQGYAIVATDYVGLGTPGRPGYLNGKEAANNVVDSVVAVENTFTNLASKWAIVGHSQGGAAAISSAHQANQILQQRKTVKKLNYLGVVAAGVPANLDKISFLIRPDSPLNITDYTLGFFMLILAGVQDAYPQIHLNSIFTGLGKQVLGQSDKYCLNEYGKYLDSKKASLKTVLQKPLDSIPGMGQILQDYFYVPATGYDRPIFMGQGLKDDTVPAPSAISLATQLTLNRQPLTFKVYPAADHMQVLAASQPDSTKFLQELFNK